MAACLLRASLAVVCAWIVFTVILPPVRECDLLHVKHDLNVLELDHQSPSRCDAEYRRVTSGRTTGLSEDLLERSRAYVGNRHRLAKLTVKLLQREAIHAVVCGGSISIGHGVHPRTTLRYSNQLELWLKTNYPVRSPKNTTTPDGTQTKHQVLNTAQHGADMCGMAKRMNFMELPPGFDPDLFVLEFALNDYEGQDDNATKSKTTDVFFEGFQEKVTCAEVVVYRLLTQYPNAAVVFLEFRSAVLSRNTAQQLHMSVAQHYQVPMISYADALFPPLYRLMEKLEPYEYSLPRQKVAVATNQSSSSTLIESEMQPYPHGCSECRIETIEEQFRRRGCRSLCYFLAVSGLVRRSRCEERHGPPGMRHCYVPFIAHDTTHPSAVGHKIAADLIADLIADTRRLACQGRVFEKHSFPKHGGLTIAGPNFGRELRARSDFDLVLDTTPVFTTPHELLPSNHSAGFSLPRRSKGGGRMGWIATNPQGGEYITFDIDLPKAKCYDVFLSVLRSYETVGTFSVSVTDLQQQPQDPPLPPQVVDCLWKPRISVPSDFQIAPPGVCTGKCRVIVQTNPQVAGRNSNQIKIFSLSARKCL